MINITLTLLIQYMEEPIKRINLENRNSKYYKTKVIINLRNF